MRNLLNRSVLVWLAVGLAVSGFLLSACGDEEEPTLTPTATNVPAPTVERVTPAVQPTETATKPPLTPTGTSPPATATPTSAEVPATPTAITEVRSEPVSFEAASAGITVDGDTLDWSGIRPTSVRLQQIEPIPGLDMGELGAIDVDLRVAVDRERIYVLLEIPDDFDYIADDHGLSAALAVMLRIDDPAAPHMGTTEEEQERSLGKVDIWHWELDCGPGEMSGGVTGIAGGNDPACNFDDEWSTTPEDREDDGTPQAENSLAGVWDHTARARGQGADGIWIFEMSRKLQTGDPDDAQLTLGETAYAALAYWDADETPDGWTDAGHLQSSTGGWIEIALPASPVAAVAEPISFEAASANITVDGETSDWSGIRPTSVRLQQIEPIPGLDMGELGAIDVDLRVAVDRERIYVLLEIPDDFDYIADDHGLSAALAVMLRIDDPAAPHMGTTEEEQERSLGKVDIWHWELDCGPGEMSGGVTGIAGGNDPACNFDDEWSTTPEDREDDGTPQAENSLAGVWDHTARARGQGADGIWSFRDISKIQTGDPDDAQLTPGETVYVALAYWDADETLDGWTDAGHLQSSTGGWIEVTLE